MGTAGISIIGTADETAAVILYLFTRHPEFTPPGGIGAWKAEETQSNEAIASWIIDS